MEFFKTDVLQKEFDSFQKEVLTDVLKCDLCQKDACESFHQKFLVSCNFCRENQHKACKRYNIAKEVLFKSIDDSTKEYVKNFITDFLNLLPKSLQRHYQVTKTVHIPKEKVYDVRSYHKSNKKRSQAVYKKFDQFEKINYSIKRQKRTFYKRF